MNALARGAKLPERQVPPIGMAAIDAYLAVSGDDNPIHTDPGLARRAGLDGVPVPGMLIMGMLGRLVEDWAYTDTVRRLHADFVSPVLAGDALVLGGRVVRLDAGAQTAVLRLTAMKGDRLCVMGEAEIVLKAE